MKQILYKKKLATPVLIFINFADKHIIKSYYNVEIQINVQKM